MSNRNIYLLITAFFSLLAGCRIKTMSFNDSKIDSGFFNKVPVLWKAKLITDIDSVTVYRALIREELVDRDGIPEFKLINEDSKQTRAGLVGYKNYHQLYLCKIYTHKKKDTLCLFLASSFNHKDECTRIGPAYLGVIRMKQINMMKALKIDTGKKGNYFVSDTLKSKLIFLAEQKIPVSYESLCCVYEPGDTACIVPRSVDSACRVRIREIINLNTNKIGGEKATLYPIQKIFSDPDALIFRYFKTIRF